MNEQGIMLTGTVAPDGYYVNIKGEKTSYIPGWFQDGTSWKYARGSGYYAANQWIRDADGKWYYSGMAAVILASATVPDGYHVDANGVWDGQPAPAVTGGGNPGSRVTAAFDIEG